MHQVCYSRTGSTSSIRQPPPAAGRGCTCGIARLGGGGLAVLVAPAGAPALVAPRACSAEAPGLPGGPGAGQITIKNLCSTSCRNPKRKLRRSIAGSQSAARNGSRMGVYMSWVSYIYVCVCIYTYIHPFHLYTYITCLFLVRNHYLAITLEAQAGVCCGGFFCLFFWFLNYPVRKTPENPKWRPPWQKKK